MPGNLENFLDLPEQFSDPVSSRYAVLPVPFEGTVSYKTGTAGGPLAILEASGQVELFDSELRGEFHTAGIATYPMIQPAAGIDEELARVGRAALPILRDGKFLLTLGGEHSLTCGLVQAAAEAHGHISVLQIDAHADLRDSYEGTKYSHACVMRRILEMTDRIAQVGIRSFSNEEHLECAQQVKRFITPADMDVKNKWIGEALELLGEKIYVTVDIDAFDPAIAPGTGAPEPGGLTWEQVCSLLRRVCTEREVVAADIMEVRPIPPNHITEVLAANLAYKIIAYTQL